MARNPMRGWARLKPAAKVAGLVGLAGALAFGSLKAKRSHGERLVVGSIVRLAEKGVENPWAWSHFSVKGKGGKSVQSLSPAFMNKVSEVACEHILDGKMSVTPVAIHRVLYTLRRNLREENLDWRLGNAIEGKKKIIAGYRARLSTSKGLVANRLKAAIADCEAGIERLERIGAVVDSFKPYFDGLPKPEQENVLEFLRKIPRQ